MTQTGLGTWMRLNFWDIINEKKSHILSFPHQTVFMNSDDGSNASKGRGFCDNERFNFRLRGGLHLYYKISTNVFIFGNFDLC